MKLTRKQQNKLLEWAAEGLRLDEINERAAKFDPPFEVEWLQLKHARKRAGKRFNELRERFEQEAFNEGLARRAVRLREKMARHSLLKQVISERGQAEDMQGVAGGKTGLLVKDYKGQSERAVYKTDVALLKELRDLEREIAIELGQWAERREVSGPDGGAIPVSISDLINKVYGSGPEPSGE